MLFFSFVRVHTPENERLLDLRITQLKSGKSSNEPSTTMTFGLQPLIVPGCSQSFHFSTGFHIWSRPRHVAGIRSARPIGHPANVPRNALGMGVESELPGRHVPIGGFNPSERYARQIGSSLVLLKTRKKKLTQNQLSKDWAGNHQNFKT